MARRACGRLPDQTIRREIEGFAHVIFAGSPAQREFWLGQRDLGPDEIRARYGGLKPCLHGSDAHKLDDVASPFGDRFSWIKGGLEFDALRQACIDPGGRAHVGAEPPASATPSQVISEVRDSRRPLDDDAGHSAQSGTGRHHRRSRFGQDRARRHDRGGLRFHLGRGVERRGVGQSILPRARPFPYRPREGQGELGGGRAQHARARRFGRERAVQLRARALSVAAVRRGAVLVERPDGRPASRNRARHLRGAPRSRAGRRVGFRRIARTPRIAPSPRTRSRGRSRLADFRADQHRTGEGKARRDL